MGTDTSDATAYVQHPAAQIMPAMDADQFATLVGDIRSHGLRQPVVIHEGMVLDGWHRYRACQEAGVVDRFEFWSGQGDPMDWVVSVNLARRHLSQSQRATIAARLATHYEDIAAERRRSGTLPPIGGKVGTAASEAAKDVGASPRSTERAQRLDRERPDLFEKVKSGALSLGAAEAGAFPPDSPRPASVARKPGKSRESRGPAVGSQLTLFDAIEEKRWKRIQDLAAEDGVDETLWLRTAVDRELDIAEARRAKRLDRRDVEPIPKRGK